MYLVGTMVLWLGHIMIISGIKLNRDPSSPRQLKFGVGPIKFSDSSPAGH